MGGIRSTVIAITAAFAFVAASEQRADAWVLSEHARITKRAIEKIETQGSPLARTRLAESADALRLCRAPHTCGPRDVTLESLPAIAADHSCTPAQLGTYIDNADGRDKWIRDVLGVGDEYGQKLAKLDAAGGGVVEDRVDLRRALNIKLQLVDDDYAGRAVLDWSHFQLARERGPLEIESYLAFVLDPARDSNASAAYANYHAVALHLAARAQPIPDLGARQALLRRALLAEVFALHFLEDSFSSGHFTGHWGSEETRLGTHDQYSIGMEAQRWKSPLSPYVAHGDAFLSDAELELVSDAVAKSWMQVLSAASDEQAARRVPEETLETPGFEGFDSCKDERAPSGIVKLARSRLIKDVLAEEPIPAPRSPPLQRFRGEKSVFFGVAAGGDVGISTIVPMDSGDRGILSRYRATARVGYGARGFTYDPLNSQAFFDAGFTGLYVDATTPGDGFSLSGWTMRLRAPGLITAVDGLIVILLAETTRSPFWIKLVANAGQGGVFKLWTSWRVGGPVYGQFSLFRDATFNRYPSYRGTNPDPTAREKRHELLAPLFTFRSSIPISGDSWAQSTDFYLDLGAQMTWATSEADPFPGAFLSFSASSRVFP